MYSNHLALDPVLDVLYTYLQHFLKNNLRVLAPSVSESDVMQLTHPAGDIAAHDQPDALLPQPMSSSSECAIKKRSVSVNIQDIYDVLQTSHNLMDLGQKKLEACDLLKEGLNMRQLASNWMKDYGVDRSDLNKFASLYTPRRKSPRVKLSPKSYSRALSSRSRRRRSTSHSPRKFRRLSSPKKLFLVKERTVDSDSKVIERSTQVSIDDITLDHESHNSLTVLKCYPVILVLLSLLLVFLSESPGIFVSKHLTVIHSGCV